MQHNYVSLSIAQAKHTNGHEQLLQTIINSCLVCLRVQIALLLVTMSEKVNTVEHFLMSRPHYDPSTNDVRYKFLLILTIRIKHG